LNLNLLILEAEKDRTTGCTSMQENTARFGAGRAARIWPRFRRKCHENAALWSSHASIFDAWPRLTIQSPPVFYKQGSVEQISG